MERYDLTILLIDYNEENFGKFHEYFKKRHIETKEKETHFSSLGFHIMDLLMVMMS